MIGRILCFSGLGLATGNCNNGGFTVSAAHDQITQLDDRVQNLKRHLRQWENFFIGGSKRAPCCALTRVEDTRCVGDFCGRWNKTRLHRPVDINVTGYDEPATTASGAWVTGDTTNDKWLGYLFLSTCLSPGYPAIRWPMPRPD